MIARIRKQKWLSSLMVIFFLLISFLITRLIRLDLIPIFTDEAIYIRWAQIASYDPAWRFISLSDGKQPLFIWLAMVIIRFIKDPLVAGRLVSVLAGLGTMIGLFFLSRELFKEKGIGFITALLYLFYPFALMYDRMALMDGMVAMFAVWALYLEVLLIRTLRLDVALILGITIGGSILTKSSGFFNLYLLPFSLLLFAWGKSKKSKKFLLWLGLVMVVMIEAQVIYSILRLSPLFHMINQKNAIFVYPLTEWLKHPWQFLWGNLKGLGDWFARYTSWPVIGLISASFLIERKRVKEKLLLLIWFAAPLVVLALFGRVLYPRFIFFMTLSLLPLAALTLSKLFSLVKKKPVFVFLFFFFIALWLRADWFLLTNPYLAPIPESDKGQYLNDWPAGGGIREAVAFFENESKKEKIYIGTEGTFGLLPYGLEIYLFRNQNVKIGGFWPLTEEVLEQILKETEERSTYFVFNQTQKPPLDWPLEFVARYQKGIKPVYLSVYKLEP